MLPRANCAPSPLAGEGWGEGWPRARCSLGAQLFQSCGETLIDRARRVVPLSLTLPRIRLRPKAGFGGQERSSQ
jgi:hypothetical protein